VTEPATKSEPAGPAAAPAGPPAGPAGDGRGAFRALFSRFVEVSFLVAAAGFLFRSGQLVERLNTIEGALTGIKVQLEHIQAADVTDRQAQAALAEDVFRLCAAVPQAHCRRTAVAGTGEGP
jgi:hypothetical protein